MTHSGDTTSAEDIARRYLAGEDRSAEDALQLVGKLQGKNRFRTGTAVAQKALDKNPGPLRIRLLQKLMVCTYKDLERQQEARFRDAESLAKELEATLGGMSDAECVETCGIIGAMYKYRWFRAGGMENLEQSVAWYSGQPHAKHLADSEGYLRVNAAFVLDLMAAERDKERSREESQSRVEETEALRRKADALRERADGLRRAVLQDLRPEGKPVPSNESWWVLATVFEAYFGLRRYDEARAALDEAITHGFTLPSSWERASTVAQVINLASLHAKLDPTAVKASGAALAILTSGRQEYLSTLAGQRIGLALSGGGFRASLYHIGVLAKLAELDLLRHVEVLSCVSGGSIVGAAYYLALRHELQTQSDAEITRDHYVALMKTLAEDFLVGVQRNLRNRMLFRGWKFWTSSSERMGELYDQELFGRVRDEFGSRRRHLDELKVTPPRQPALYPAYDNWQRAAKVPILVLNSTTLNTGHNWQFTAAFIGEPEPGDSEQLGDTAVFPRAWFDEGAPRVRLGHAVAASACVPGLFEPLEVRNLYQKVSGIGYVTRLVDGGVCDNQGVASLLYHNCDVVLVSDASGQMPTAEAPAKGRLGVYQRTTSMLMARVRELQYHSLVLERSGGPLKKLLYVHLKRGLGSEKVRVTIPTVQERLDRASGNNATDARLTGDGLNVEVLRRLAEIRTDLDAFNTVEAYALMYAGYRMTEVASEQLRELVTPSAGPPAPPPEWTFLAIRRVMEDPDGGRDVKRLTKLLSVAASAGFKIWRLWTPEWLSRGVGGLSRIAGWLPRWLRVVAVVGLLAAVVFMPWPATVPLPSVEKRAWLVAGGFAAVIAGWAVLFPFLRLCDRFYIRWGEDLLRPPAGPTPHP